MAIKNILFDLDGTITDSQEGIINCLKYALEKCQHSIPDEATFKELIGPPLPVIFETLLDTKDSTVVQRCVTAYRERFADVGKFENQLYDGILSLLMRLNGTGGLFIATSKPQVFAKQIIEHFDCTIYFNNVYGSNLDNSLSNKTELLAHVLRKENIDPLETVMVGDRSHDVTGAIENDIIPIGVTWGYGSLDELKSAGCTKFAYKPSDIIEFL
ncbi:MAG: HAD hydrolase-like protein [Fibrobacterales bacterium]